MSELPIRTVAIIVIFIIVLAIGLIWLFSGFGTIDTTETFFNVSKNLSQNSSATVGAIS